MLRTPTQYRPWQHAVEAAAGLLWLAATLVADPAGTASAYNFGPPAQAAAVPAGRLAEMLAAAWSSTPAPPPTIGADEGFGLDDTAARADLGWHACWSLDRALFATAEWHRAGPSAAGVVTAAQVTRYSADAAAAGVRWAQPCRTPQS
jgi:CDP-glucose 4,6-dehydratase